MFVLEKETALALILAGLATVSGLASRPVFAQDTSGQKQPETTQYEVLTKGLLANPVFSLKFRTARLRIDIRDLIMGPGRADAVPTPTRMLMELRGGTVVSTTDGEKQTHRAGDFWEVGKGSALSLENPGDVAVIRVIYLFEGAN